MRDETIWRYMDFTKFVALISSNSLFFCRADKFDDPFEGSISKKHYEREISELRSSTPEYEKEKNLYEKFGEEYRKYVYINCWHQNDFESAALWKLYLKSNEGISIKSSRGRLSASVHDSGLPVWNVPVKYIDYENDDVPVPTNMAPFRYKRKSFEHEREIRAIIYADSINSRGEQTRPLGEYGITVSTDLKELIEEIVVAPTSPSWFIELVEEVARHYGIRIPVRRSSITIDNPVFFA